MVTPAHMCTHMHTIYLYLSSRHYGRGHKATGAHSDLTYGNTRKKVQYIRLSVHLSVSHQDTQRQ